jgi:hypothetical protein
MREKEAKTESDYFDMELEAVVVTVPDHQQIPLRHEEVVVVDLKWNAF